MNSSYAKLEKILLKIALVCYLISIITTHTLWTRQNVILPKFPPFGFSITNSYFLKTLFLLLLLSLILSLWPKFRKLALWTAILSWLIFVISDLNCLQPQFIFFNSIIILWLFSNWKTSPEMFCRSVTFLISSYYIFGGIHKINPNYYSQIFDWISKPILIVAGQNEIFVKFINCIGYLSPYLEISIGLCLLFQYTATIGHVFGIIMHLLILFSIGPWGQNFNSSIYAWNISFCIIHAVILFKFLNKNQEIIPFKFGLGTSTLVASIFAFPLFFTLIQCNRYLAYDLYSGKAWFGFIIISDQQRLVLPVSIQKKLLPYNTDSFYIDISSLSLSETNVPVYPEKRTYKFYKSWLEKLTHDKTQMILTNGSTNEIIN